MEQRFGALIVGIVGATLDSEQRRGPVQISGDTRVEASKFREGQMDRGRQELMGLSVGGGGKLGETLLEGDRPRFRK